MAPMLSPEQMAMEQRWRELVEQGELDVYTCLSLRNEEEEYDGKAHELDRETVKIMIALVSLQVIVPTLMLFHQARQFPAYAVDRQLDFRVIGFVLYLYSIRNMYGNSLSECRVLYLNSALESLPLRYVWPAILGEVVNSFASMILCLTLFTVFCGAARLPELVINCISINFIGNVDEEFVSEELKSKAAANFHKNMEMVRNAERQPIDPTSVRSPRLLLDYFLYATRVGGTLCLGIFLACVFLFSHLSVVCDNLSLSFFGLC